MIPLSISIPFAIFTICIPSPIKEEQMHIYWNLLVQINSKPKSILSSYRKRVQSILICWIVLNIRKENPVIRSIHLNVFDLFVLHLETNIYTNYSELPTK